MIGILDHYELEMHVRFAPKTGQQYSVTYKPNPDGSFARGQLHATSDGYIHDDAIAWYMKLPLQIKISYE